MARITRPEPDRDEITTSLAPDEASSMKELNTIEPQLGDLKDERPWIISLGRKGVITDQVLED